ncbi:MAG: D-alanyl-D-alanine carboxypeptidase [Deltaproteobacteria bacterium]|nr:D-alanyl-D-alanine carboxypeptidase [Deltaproteobacteria bacterium]
MKRIIRLVFLICAIFILTQICLSLSCLAAPKDSFTVKAKAAVLINVASGQTIFEQNADRRIPPASLTKLMTLYVAYDAVDNGYVSFADQVHISKKAWKTGGSRMFLRVDTKVELEKILKGIAVVSGNDACVAVAEHLSGVEEVFVDAMNAKALEIGLYDTVFKDSNGLSDKGQYTTANDMARLALSYVKQHPEALPKHSAKEMTFNNITQRNRNGLLWLDYGVDGLKTGHLESAGYHLVATAEQDGERYIAVVLGAKSETKRENIALKLLNYGFRNYKTIEVVPAREEIDRLSVWYGKNGFVPVGLPKALRVTVGKEHAKDISTEKELPERVFAPIDNEQTLGHYQIFIAGEPYLQRPLKALEAVAPAGFFVSAMHFMILAFITPPFWGLIVLGIMAVAFCLAFLLAVPRRKKKSSRSDIDDLLGK